MGNENIIIPAPAGFRPNKSTVFIIQAEATETFGHPKMFCPLA